MPPPSPRAFAGLTAGAVGVVFGDIGTSPLYAFRECVRPEHGFARSPADQLGILSLIIWALTLVVTVKYVCIVMRAHNRGQGGICALLALLPEPLRAPRPGQIGGMALLILFGAALLYGDGAITPAISVLSAVEGLEVATPALRPAVVPLTCAVLLALFALQRRGTDAVGRLFGPVMLLWFAVLAGLGAWHVGQHPDVLRALSPLYAVQFFADRGLPGARILGSVVLAVTGTEALYSDLGHFGLGPIRVAWFALVKPALVLAYLGQGALLLHDPSAVENPFFALVPRGPWTIALVGLAGAATVIASQALISGAFSLTHQAVQLGYFPRVQVRHTSPRAEGQIYVPVINWSLAVVCLLLVLAFQGSTRLAAAYGLAVTCTMTITSIAFYAVMRRTWAWPLPAALAVLLFFLAIDVPFAATSLLKLPSGGYVPLLIAGVVFPVMVIWRKGHLLLAQQRGSTPKLGEFLAQLEAFRVVRVPGGAFFLDDQVPGVPSVLLQHVWRNRALQATVLLAAIHTEHVPRIEKRPRWRLAHEAMGFHRVQVHYGYMEHPDVESLLEELSARGMLDVSPDDVTFYLERSTPLATDRGQMGKLAESIFAFLERNACPPDLHLAMPPAQVVELGARLEL